MSFDAGAITGRMGFDIGPYTQSMLQATSIAQLFPATVTNFLANPLLGIIGVAKNVGGALVSMFKDTTKYADDMGDLADQVGVAVENLTALGQVASMSGGSVEGTADAYRFLGRNVAEAMEKADSAAGKTFDRPGVKLVDARGQSRSLELIMMDLADAMQQLPAGAQRTALAMDLLGRSGTQMVPTLAQGSAALREQMDRMSEYGAAVTQQSRESSDRWNDAMGEMSLAWQGMQNQLAEPIRDALLPWLTGALGWVRENMPAISKTIATAMEDAKWYVDQLGPTVFLMAKGTVAAIKTVADALETTWSTFKTTIAAIIAFQDSPKNFMKDPFGATKSARTAIDVGLRLAADGFKSTGNKAGPAVEGPMSSGIMTDTWQPKLNYRPLSEGGGVTINANVPKVDEDKVGKAVADHVQPKIDQNMREIEAGAKAGNYRKRVKGGL